MSSTTNYPGTGADDSAVGAVAWSSPAGATADGGTSAFSFIDIGEDTHYLKVTNFGFAVPAGATINGVAVEVERRVSTPGAAAVRDSVLRLVKGGAVVGGNKAAATNWTNSFVVASYGSASDLWGTTLTGADVNASNFGVVLSAVNHVSSDDIYSAQVDFIRVTVYYTASSGAASATVMLMGGD
jgi:hypothetical protein